MSIEIRYWASPLASPFIGFVDLLDRDHFDIEGDAMLATGVEHFLSFRQPADQRSGTTSPSHDQPEYRDRQRLVGLVIRSRRAIRPQIEKWAKSLGDDVCCVSLASRWDFATARQSGERKVKIRAARTVLGFPTGKIEIVSSLACGRALQVHVRGSCGEGEIAKRLAGRSIGPSTRGRAMNSTENDPGAPGIAGSQRTDPNLKMHRLLMHIDFTPGSLHALRSSARMSEKMG